MIELRKLESSDFEMFKSWITSKDELMQFAGSIFDFPLTDQQLHIYITDQRRIAYKVVLLETNSIIGNAELNLERSVPRLSRVLIGNKENRNKGIGRMIIHKMLEKLFTEFNFKEADLNVFDWNTSAITCYERVGFTVSPNTSSTQYNNDQVWTVLNMKITKDVWQETRLLNKHKN